MATTVCNQTNDDEYGLPRFFESARIHASGLIVSENCEQYSHWNASRSLSDWLVESKVPGIHGIDTRQLTKILREKGSMLAKVRLVKIIHLHYLVF